jgi:hypothetical protein
MMTLVFGAGIWVVSKHTFWLLSGGESYQ